MQKLPRFLEAFDDGGHPFKAYFKSRGVSQVVLSRVLGVPRGTLAGWLNGHSRMPPLVEQELEDLRSRIEAERESVDVDAGVTASESGD